LSNDERSRLNTVFVVNNFLFGAVGSALASLLWSLGGWSFVMFGAIFISLIAQVVWLFSKTPFNEMDGNLKI
jgi:protein-S-isoprenylcysteine O-methyltransferase Ste14